LLQDEEHALDAMQDVFVNLLKSRTRLSGRFLSSLLYTIATNVCLNQIKQRRRRAESAGAGILETIAAGDDHVRDFIAREALDRVFRRERPLTRVIAVLHLVDGLSLEETARETGMSVSGVRKRLRQLRERAVAEEGMRNA
jgi:RNA polymerase sigma-70 factor (ECF subfamily)